MALRPIAQRLCAAAACLLCVAAAPDPSFVPVFNEDFPDPFVLLHASEFIAYSTNNGPNVPIAISRDLIHWSFATVVRIRGLLMRRRRREFATASASHCGCS